MSIWILLVSTSVLAQFGHNGMSPYLYDQNIVALTYEYDSVGSYSELVNIVSSYMRSTNMASQIMSQEMLRGISVSIATQEVQVFIIIIQQGTICARHAVSINGKFSIVIQLHCLHLKAKNGRV